MPENRSLLIVDDEPNVLKSLKRLLLDTDYMVYTAESGEVGLEIIKTHDIKLVISDYRMPGMNGVEFLNKIRETHPDTIRMILSGYADVIAVVEAINDGQVYRFITKPWNDQELLTSIKRAIEQYELQKENSKLYLELHKRNLELQILATTLEEKVAARTHDLELNNRALNIAQNILSMLPVGIIGIDSCQTIVYINSNLKDFISTDAIGLGLPIGDSIPKDINMALNYAIKSRDVICLPFGDNGDKYVICTPLSNGAGAIGIFSYSDYSRFGPIVNFNTD